MTSYPVVIDTTTNPIPYEVVSIFNGKVSLRVQKETVIFSKIVALCKKKVKSKTVELINL